MTSATWRPLQAGRFGADAAVRGVDAMLVWADASGFVDFVPTAAPAPELIPVLVELKAHGDAKRLADELVAEHGGDVTPTYVGLPTRFCTARFSADYCQKMFAGTAGKMIERFEMQMAVVPGRSRERRSSPAAPAPVARPEVGEVLVGIIDSGCPFAHHGLRVFTAGSASTRVASIWDQDGAAAFGNIGGAPPPGFGYGREVARAQLDMLIDKCSIGGSVAEAVCYDTAGCVDMRARFTHGAAVTGLLVDPRTLGARLPGAPMSAPSWETTHDRASEADIVFVNMPGDSVQDSSSASLPRSMLDGLRYIVGCSSRQTKRVVVNISNASSRGTHDGTSIIELAMLELIGEQRKQGRDLQIVLPAGNSFDEARHARVDSLRAGQLMPIKLRVSPASEAPHWVCVRVPDGATDIKIALVPPGQQLTTRQPVSAGEAKGLCQPSSTRPTAAVVFPATRSGLPTMALIVLAPTLGYGLADLASHGDWTIVLESAKGFDEPIDLYVTRNQTNPGALVRGRQSYFVEKYDAYDPQRWLRHKEADPVPARSPVRRRGTMSSLGNVAQRQGVVVVGAGVMRECRPSVISSSGPPAGQHPLRNGPDIAAYTSVHSALPGINAAGSLSGATVRVIGTSFTAPQIARILVNEGVLPQQADHPDPERTGIGFVLR